MWQWALINPVFFTVIVIALLLVIYGILEIIVKAISKRTDL